MRATLASDAYSTSASWVSTHRRDSVIHADYKSPALRYPQFKQVAHPSMITTALVLHLWHMVADGGKRRAVAGDFDVLARASATGSAMAPPRPGLMSEFFFERCS